MPNANPFKAFYEYYANSGVRKDLPVFKRMMVEIPYIPIGFAISTVCIVGTYYYVTQVFDKGIGYTTRYTVMRPDDPRIPKYRKHVINPEGSTS